MDVTAEPDPLNSSSYAPDRVFYALGAMLSTDDFRDEQTYHRGRLARALAYLYGSGTVSGLKVEYEGPMGPDEHIKVRPGIAIDRLGRVVEVPGDWCIRLDRWYKAQDASELQQGLHASANGVIADVFIRFAACERGITPAFASGPFDATDFTVPSRLRDAFKLELVLRKETAPPLPQSPWPNLASDPDLTHRKSTLNDAVFASWRGGTDQWNEQGLVPLPEHAVGQDTTSVFLARLVIPATAGSPPVRTNSPVSIDNNSRSFLYPAAALARWVGA